MAHDATTTTTTTTTATTAATIANIFNSARISTAVWDESLQRTN